MKVPFIYTFQFNLVFPPIKIIPIYKATVIIKLFKHIENIGHFKKYFRIFMKRQSLIKMYLIRQAKVQNI